MKRFYYTVAIIILVILSCEKPTEFPVEQDVVFKTTTNSTGFKSTCDDIAHSALITIDSITYTVDVFYLNGTIYTNSMKLKSGAHTLNMFVLKNEADSIVFAAPEEGSTYANFVNQALPLAFTVDAFFKKEISLQLLCFEPNDYENFGFNWFTIEKIIPREVCFYGDICVDDLDLLVGSLYENQSRGLQYIMPAIFRVDVYRNDNYLISYNNEAWYGESHLCVKYPDYEGVVDNFKFELWVLGVNGYELFQTYTTTDDVPLADLDENNSLYFAFGNCETTLLFSGCETAFAYDAYKAFCFTEISYISSTNWGWSNGTYAQSANSYTMDLYAGAGGCDISKAYLVGNLVLTYNNDHVRVTYNLNAGYEFTDIHLYVGYTKYQDGNPTVAPGQFPYKTDDNGTGTHTFDLPDAFTGPIYLIAHAEVCKN